MSAKRKWISFNFDEESLVDKTRNKKSNQLTRKKQTKVNVSNSCENVKFIEQFEPRNLDDLAVHPKKIAELNDWIGARVDNLRKNVSMLLITGPTGCGKTTSLKLLCKSKEIEIQEWINPVDNDYELFKGPGQSVKFFEFLTESRCPSLFSSSFNSKSITLVKDFPNTLIHNPQEFENILKNFVSVSNFNTVLVFICTDGNNKNNVAKLLFTQEVMLKYNISQISFNSCSATILKKMLKNVQERGTKISGNFKTLSNDVLEAIVSSSLGDIRFALSQYYFSSLKGCSEIPTHTLKKQDTKKRKPTKTLSTIARDEQLGLFHSVGRVLNPKKLQHGNSWRIHCELEPLIDEFSTQPTTFVLFLQENYVKYFGDINDLSKAADVLSLAHTFSAHWFEQNDTLLIALRIAVLGLMVFNEHKVSKWTQITGPTKYKLIDQDEEKMFRTYNPTDYCYYNLITKSEKFDLIKH